MSRFAPYRVRARYAKALAEIPLPVRSSTSIDPDSLTVIGEGVVDDRRLRFGVLYAVPRLWITCPGQLPAVLGFVTGFGGVTDPDTRTELHITERDHLEWASRPGRSTRIKHAARTAWSAAATECEG